MSDIQPVRVPMDGIVASISLAPMGVVCALLRLDRESRRLCMLDMAGNEIHRIDFAFSERDGSSLYVVRISSDGSTWYATGRSLVRLAANGSAPLQIALPLAPDEKLGSFLLTGDDILIAAHQGLPARVQGRVAKIDITGSTIWSLPLLPDGLAYSGVVSVNASNQWRSQPKPAWKPREWRAAPSGEPLLRSGEIVLARFCETHSGLGCTYALDYTTGKGLWSTKPGPESTLALAEHQEFLIGVQGYGAFDLYSYAPNGTQLLHWPSHAYVVVSQAGDLVGVEMENVLPSKMRFCHYQRDGSVRKGPLLEGYYTSYPVIAADDRVAFWRNGQLNIIDAQMRHSVVWRDSALAEVGNWNRTLLSDDGVLIVGLERELLFFATDLPKVAVSPWPCGAGNMRGNPSFA